MKVISIIQPWATLIALKEKKYETRSWKTKHRGEIAIHASKKVDKHICKQEPFKSILTKHGYNENNLPKGAIIAISNLIDCLEIEVNEGLISLVSDGRYLKINGNEIEFGWYDNGRYAWELQNIKQIGAIPAKGKLGLWNYNEHIE